MERLRILLESNAHRSSAEKSWIGTPTKSCVRTWISPSKKISIAVCQEKRHGRRHYASSGE